jgi:heptosyltransferase-1
MQDILFIKTSSLGDVIHHMPALTEARRQRPQARIGWVVEEQYAALARLHPAVDEVIPVAMRRWRRNLLRWDTWEDIRHFVRAIRVHDYAAVIDTQGLTRTGGIAFFARGRSHGYDIRSIREPLGSFWYGMRHRVPYDLHAIERNRRLTALALGYAPEGEIDYGLDRARIAPPPEEPYGIFLHATARAPKEWAEENWIALGQRLEERRARIVLPWGSEREHARSERIAGALPRASVPPRQDIDAVTKLIAGAAFVVGVDTGLLHLAVALEVPTVAIFAGSEPGLTGPVGRGPIAVLGGKAHPPGVEAVAEAMWRIIPG